MKPVNPTERPYHLLMNPMSLVGLIIGISGLISATFLLFFDYLSGGVSPYLGILTFMVAPGVFFTGFFLATYGALRMRKQIREGGSGLTKMPVLDLNNRYHFRTLVISIVGGLMIIGLSALGAFRAYHFTESVEFCGTTCHTVMKPEHTAFLASPHANVSCTTCHIGPGADWFVKSKVNGLRQVWNTAFDTFRRPIPTPVHDLRPAKETCYTCHWPEKFFDSILMNRTYFRADSRKNDPWTVQMLINVGGGDKRHGRGEGIHWHMVMNNSYEYIASDEKRLNIPWVRQTKADGSVVVYKSTDPGDAEFLAKLEDPEVFAKAEIRTMDCIDCHNRPSHHYHSPERAVNESMTAGLIDPSLKYIKRHAVDMLDGEYQTEEEALAAIEAGLREEYPENSPEVEAAIEQVKKIYSQNFFPEMKVSWRAYPDHIGHMITPGCFRCHDDKHVSDTGEKVTMDCKACHTIIAQGPGTAVNSVSSGGLDFEHPEDVGDAFLKQRCDECHDGMPIL